MEAEIPQELSANRYRKFDVVRYELYGGDKELKYNFSK